MSKVGGEGSNALLGNSEEDIVTRIAWLYYKEKLTQAEIGDRIFLSRQKVQRYLEKARDLEIIRFTLKHPFVNLLGIEEKLREKCSLKDAVVVPAAHTDIEGLRRSFAMAGAQYLERRLGTAGDCTLGVGWGNTTAHLADYFEPQGVEGKIKVVSLIGNLMMNVSMNPFLMGQAIAGKLDCPFYNIWAPAIAQTKERAEVFKSEPWIHEVLEIASRADINLISIGEVSRSASLFQMGYLSGQDLHRLIGKGAVGDILSRFLDADGNLIEDEVHDRVIGIPLDALREASKTCIGVAGGPSKVGPILAAIRQRYINILITDETTAMEILSRS
ncbi:MAG: sugar-binding transcriptional regulator [Spirochaetota bacterium]